MAHKLFTALVRSATAAAALAACGPTAAAGAEPAPAPVAFDAAAWPRPAEPTLFALGESSHGNEEALRTRNRFIMQLAGQGTLSWIALETGYAEARLLDAFVRGGAGTAEDVARRGFTSGFGNLAGNVALLQAVRAANLKRPVQDRVGIIGIDLSLAGPLDSAPTMAPVRCALEGVADGPRRIALEAAFAQVVAPGLSSLAVTDAQQAAFQALSARLDASLGPAASQEARTCARIVGQGAAVFAAIPRVVTPGAMPDDAWIALSRRDEAMAANALDVFERSAKSVVLFAHTSHVLKAARRGGQLRRQSRRPTSMGEILQQRLHGRYVVIAQVEPTTGTPGDTPDLLAAFGVACATPCIVRTVDRATVRRAEYRIGINGNDEQIVRAVDADAFLFIPSP